MCQVRAEFDEYSRELRRAKDQEEFDKFMADKKASKPKKKKGKSVPRIADDE